MQKSVGAIGERGTENCKREPVNNFPRCVLHKSWPRNE